jgi:hypothetical protein
LQVKPRKGAFRVRLTALVVPLLLAAASIAGSAGTANASPSPPPGVMSVQLSTGHGVGIYELPYAGPKNTLDDLRPGDYVGVYCWVYGAAVDGTNNIWFATATQLYESQGGAGKSHAGWVYAQYVDYSYIPSGLPTCAVSGVGITLSSITGASAGMYVNPDAGVKIPGGNDTDAHPRDEVIAQCWRYGATVDGVHDSWYFVTYQDYNSYGTIENYGAWVYAWYVDNARSISNLYYC